MPKRGRELCLKIPGAWSLKNAQYLRKQEPNGPSFMKGAGGENTVDSVVTRVYRKFYSGDIFRVFTGNYLLISIPSKNEPELAKVQGNFTVP